MATRNQKLIEYLRQYSFKQAPPGQPFTLASGKKSDYFVDVKQVLVRPFCLSFIADLMVQHFAEDGFTPEAFDDVDAVAGVPFGGTLLATAFTLQVNDECLYIPQILVRKETKDHGTGKLIERVQPEGDGLRNVLLLEDVATTGGSAIQAIKALETEGLKVKKVLVVVDREEGATAALKELGVELISLVKVSELMVRQEDIKTVGGTQ